MQLKKLPEHRLFFWLHMALFLFLFQNCTVYRGSSIDLDAAIDTKTKVVVETRSGDKLKFKKLLKNDQSIVGVAKKRKTIKYLEENGFDYEQYGKFRAYIIDSLKINDIYPKNKTASTLVTIGASVLSAFTLLTITAGAIFFASWGG